MYSVANVIPAHGWANNDVVKCMGQSDQDENCFREMVYGVTDNVEALDVTIKTAVPGRSLRSVAQIEINVIRMAVWEMQNRLEIPYKVIFIK